MPLLNNIVGRISFEEHAPLPFTSRIVNYWE